MASFSAYTVRSLKFLVVAYKSEPIAISLFVAQSGFAIGHLNLHTVSIIVKLYVLRIGELELNLFSRNCLTSSGSGRLISTLKSMTKVFFSQDIHIVHSSIHL